ncbi:hypothetical protein F2Q68_00019980 [Brassica cretica]|uniref:Uncharacterized protein n=1 Tax=Brassica cretica TaxID=69181 RepID=A0A8S9FV35_BRACR|nr:hypothetical protein F2Q68_00019980 [Brassica cretica]
MPSPANATRDLPLHFAASTSCDHCLRFTLVESRHLDVEQSHACSDCGCEPRSPSTIAASCCLRKEPATVPSQPPHLLQDSPPCLTKLASSVIIVVELVLHHRLSSTKLNPRCKSKLKSTVEHCPSLLRSVLSSTVVAVLIIGIKLTVADQSEIIEGNNGDL